MDNVEIIASRIEIYTRLMKVKRKLTELRREKEDLEVLIIDEEYDLQTLTDELKKTSKE
tara:strand:+ start:4168 stop:4344 length:177 start_codon:yes stop_codon:yes gene_type:complete